MRRRVHVTIGRPSVCPIIRPPHAAVGGFAAVGAADSRYRSIAARPAVSNSRAAARRAAANADSVTFPADVGS